MFPRRLTVAEDADGDGRVAVFLPAEGVWRLIPLVDAQEQLDHGSVTLDGPEDAPLELSGRQRVRLPEGWRPSRRSAT